jgi:hypothetical protein
MSSRLAPEHAQRLQSAEARWLQGARDRLRQPRTSAPPEPAETPETEETDR